MDKLATRIVMWWLHRWYLKNKKPIFYIKGLESDYPKYLLYTEDAELYRRMDEF